MMNVKIFRLNRVAAVVSAVSLFSGLAYGTEYFWDRFDNGTPIGGDFEEASYWRWFDGNDWQSGIPGDSDWATFIEEAENAYIVKLNADRELEGLRVEVDKVILDLNGFNLDLLGSGAALLVGFDHNNGPVSQSGPNLAGELTIAGGGTLTTDRAWWGDGSSGFGNAKVIVTGANTELVINQGDNVGDYAYPWGRFDILDGAKVTASSIGYMSGLDLLIDNATLEMGSGWFGRNATDVVTVRNGGLLNVGTVNTARRGGGVTITVNDAAVHSGAFMPGHRSLTTTVDIEDGGVWRATSLLIDRETTTNSRNPRVHINVEGHRPGDESVASRLLVTGNVRLGKDKDLEVHGGDYKSEESFLTVRDGGEVLIGGRLDFMFSTRLTLDGGLVEATSMRGLEWKEEDDNGDTIFSYGEYAFVLRDERVGADAPLRIVQELMIPDTEGVDESYTGTGNVDLDNGHIDLILVLGEDEQENPFQPVIGQQFTLLRYEGTLDGHFRGLAPNSTVTFEDNGTLYELDYGSGLDGVITLTVIPEPQTLGLLLSAGLTALALRRRRSTRGVR